MRLYRPTDADWNQAEQMRKRLEEARRLLEQAKPDTFCGRQSHDPIPLPDPDKE